ncbi:uncharacterized protein [Rutidosis leptorrhynchoides]|uniref:uncharacterized protein n=1 Tax=Rutidosis leptorrhynchoides TaxID=125765 RepID=UPI003A9976D6
MWIWHHPIYIRSVEGFTAMKDEALHDLIARFRHLLSELEAHEIIFEQYEIVECLADALPERFDPYIAILRTNNSLERYTLNQLISQDHALYKGGTSTKSSGHALLQIAFVSNSRGSDEPQYVYKSSSSSHNAGSTYGFFPSETTTPVLKTENFKHRTLEVAEEDMEMVALVVNSYDALIAGSLRNCHLTAKDNDRIDKDEMEMMDIIYGKCLISSCLESGFDNICYTRCDVRDEKQVEAAVNHTITKYGPLDVLFSNAGIMGPMTTLLDMDLGAFDNTMAVNVHGMVATIKHAARAMVAKGTRGSIICTASVAGSIGGTGPYAYTTSKHAILGLMRAACGELGAYGIRVNCVSPFAMATPLTCDAYNIDASLVEALCCEAGNLKGVVLKASHVADAALFLASDESVYVSGHNLRIDGGFTVVSNMNSTKPN